MAICKGGHALMITLTIPEDIATCTAAWVDADPATRKSKLHEAHTTIMFIGRDIDDQHHMPLRRAAEMLVADLPKSVMSKGPMAMFGGNKDHLVALLDKSSKLLAMRIAMETFLKSCRVPIGRDFGFTPHVTLATGAAGAQPPVDRPPGRVFAVTGVELKLGDNRRHYPVSNI